MSRLTRELTIVNRLGLHARAAAKLVNLASAYESEITIRRESREANAKSIMAVMMLAASQGTEVVLEAEGGDAAAALDAIETLVAARFDEDE